jgi:hypothetical protein
MDQGKRGSRRRWVAYVTAPIAFGVVVVGGCAASISKAEADLNRDIDSFSRGFTLGTNAPRPSIPVPPSACPYLANVRTSERDLEQAYLTGHPAPWPQWRENFAKKLSVFELYLVAAEPHVPPEIAEAMNANVADVRLGIDQLKRAKNADDYDPGGSTTLKGYADYVEVLDLVGSQCPS